MYCTRYVVTHRSSTPPKQTNNYVCVVLLFMYQVHIYIYIIVRLVTYVVRLLLLSARVTAHPGSCFAPRREEGRAPVLSRVQRRTCCFSHIYSSPQQCSLWSQDRLLITLEWKHCLRRKKKKREKIHMCCCCNRERCTSRNRSRADSIVIPTGKK